VRVMREMHKVRLSFVELENGGRRGLMPWRNIEKLQATRVSHCLATSFTLGYDKFYSILSFSLDRGLTLEVGVGN
jgi:hypothetical protein